MAGKIHQHALLWINHDIIWKLTWLIQHLHSSNEICFVKALSGFS
ncbi:hypothetical protein ID866_8617 [Astraeus odoratus]|nr:hypothetical protein ID866_8617 [Astraeus odoratus]